MSRLFIFFAVGFAGLLNGCATVETTALGRERKEGIAYYLSKGVFRVSVVDNAGGLTVTLAGPVMIADPAFPLVAKLPRSGTSDNDVKVSVDPKTSLLSKVEVTSTGDVGTLIQNIATAVATLQAGTETGGITVFSKTYDIGELSSGAARDVNGFLVGYFIGKCGSLSTTKMPYDKILKDADTAADVKTLATSCRRMKLAGVDAASSRGLVSVEVAKPAPVPASPSHSPFGPQPPAISLSSASPSLAACAKGVCYRPMTAVAITLKVKGAFEQNDLFLLPDADKTMVVALPQGVFAEQKYTLTFSDGVLTEYDQNTKSELVGLSTLPVAVVTAILKAPAAALGLRTADLKAKADYLAQLSALQTQRATAATACKADPGSCPLTALKIIGASVTAPTVAAPATADTGMQATPAPAQTPTWLTNDAAPQ